ncbi:MAG: helix-turn-helix domain-containing protein [Lentisphaeria bacterium]
MVGNNNTIVEAEEGFYFPRVGCPIAVRRIDQDQGVSHKHDLTSVSHFHDFAELVIINHGIGTQVIDTKKYVVKAGDVFLIQGKSVHSFIERHNLKIVNVMFAPNKLPLPLHWLRRLNGYNILFELEPSLRTDETFAHRLRLSALNLTRVNHIVDQLSDELQSGQDGCELGAYQKLLELIIVISRHYDESSRSMNISSLRIGKVIAKIETDFAHHWQLKDLAKIAYVSPNTLMRYFRKIEKCSPLEYLKRIRLYHAALLLEKGTDPISVVSERCGFSDSNYFSYAFKKYYGISPRCFRNRTEI